MVSCKSQTIFLKLCLCVITVWLKSSESINDEWPAKCNDVKMIMPQANDGEYCLRVQQDTEIHLVKIYCNNMTENPQEFLTLPAGEEENYSKTNRSGDHRLTGDVYFSKLAINISTLQVKGVDFTFTQTTNMKGSETGAYSPAWGKAWACSGCDSTSTLGEVSIDLTGTVFQLPRYTQFVKGGHASCILNFMHSETFQTFSAKCGGSCGGCIPKGYDSSIIQLVINASLSKSECTSTGDVILNMWNKPNDDSTVKSLSTLLNKMFYTWIEYNFINVEIIVFFSKNHCTDEKIIECKTLPVGTEKFPVSTIMDHMSCTYKAHHYKYYHHEICTRTTMNIFSQTRTNKLFECVIS